MNKFEMMVRGELEDLRDDGYADFVARGLPGYPREQILGVRTPEIRRVTEKALMAVFGKKGWSRAEVLNDGLKSSRLTKRPGDDFDVELYHEMNKFLEDLPHRYLEYDFVHEGVVSGMTDFSECLAEVEKFLPYVGNWATCDSFSPKVFKKHLNELLPVCYEWLESERAFTVRYGVVMLMRYYLEDGTCSRTHFERILRAAKRTESSSALGSLGGSRGSAGGSGEWSAEEVYYVEMATAWYFATALAKQWDAAVRVLENRELPCKIHNLTIRKANESLRIERDAKEYLKRLKV